jgi:MGT family glycosyltransferase
MAFWGKLIAKKLAIPFVSSTTTFAFNQYSARVMKQSGPGLFSMIKSIPKINKCIKRLRDKGYAVKSVLDIIANDIDKLGSISANCQVAHTVDQIAVLQQADVFVTHCGMNSVSEALYYGVPLVLFPKTPEQQGVANRVLELKAGITLEDTTPEGIQKAVQTALERQELRDGAATIQASFHQCGGAKAAANLIEGESS